VRRNWRAARATTPTSCAATRTSWSSSPGKGADTIRVGFDYTLPATLENLELAGDLDLDGTGNDLDNRITGNAGDNLLDGGAGADTLAGGAGDDTYLLDDPGDVVQENPGDGTDGVRAPFSHVLADNVENLELTGAQDADGTGNALNNVLIGNAGVNVLTGLAGDDQLDGGAGADSLVGGSGDDTYTLDDPGDAITELPGEGVDTVRAGFGFVLPAVLENLTLLGAGDFSGEGNAADNTLIGNAGANALTGHAGNDRLDGGAGTTP
jgi:Ca2+-binding RTX toxin-like protein